MKPPLLAMIAVAIGCLAAQPAAAWSTYKVTLAGNNVPPTDPFYRQSVSALNAAQRSLVFLDGPGPGYSYSVCVQGACSMLSPPIANAAFSVLALSNFGHVAGSVYAGGNYAFVGGAVIGYDRGTCLGCGLALSSESKGVNSYGHVTGWAEFTTGGGKFAFKYTSGTGIVTLGSLGGDSEGRAINEWGHVAGNYEAPGPTTRAFRHDPPGSMVDLGTLGASTWAYAINDSNWVVGCSVNSSFGVLQAYRHNGQNILGLPALSTTGPSCALDINNSNVAVGYSTTGGGQRATIFKGSNIKNLNLLMDPADPNSASWLLTTATGINDSGAIVGNGKYLGVDRAFVLTPLP